ncbi:hypothetical protein BCR34DRAFT_579117 [Clohesyomyces aquaticus]|uniref:Zn(2)-C6 fungal-type domain-containing protein n=1 Tax=Clohesyomyces aquaticus TaxID=1231657 RepID=A0A1Y1YCG3_9PLEO|nr:hypothetical protein BCR34DRAFT_579117 [Clohesyomyces aquaticus]
MPSRRTHQKSRHGCAQCKTAHVKCDEKRPVCGRCMRSGKECIFRMLSTSSGQVLASPTAISISSTSRANLPFGNPPINAPATGRWSPSWQDLQLLHHYTVATYVTIADHDHIRELWQTTVPRMALKYEFLMHGLLSVAALHLASSHPESDTSYTDAAICHHDLALAEYRVQLNDIDSENCSALFACSTMVILFAFGFSLSRVHCGAGIQRPVQEITNIFVLLRGSYALIQESWHWLETGELSLLFQERAGDASTVLPHEVMASFRRLEEFLESAEADFQEKSVYQTAIRRLKECFVSVLPNHADKGLVLSWPMLVEPVYIVFLTEERPMALVILAHYATVLDTVKSSWWALGWGKQLLLDICQLLSEEYQSLVWWPQIAIQRKDGLLN